MPKASALSDNAPVFYRNLVDTIRQEITKTQDKVQKQKAICYWKIGRHIAKHLLNDQGKSGYNKRLYARLGHDLKINEMSGPCFKLYHFTDHSHFRTRVRN